MKPDLATLRADALAAGDGARALRRARPPPPRAAAAQPARDPEAPARAARGGWTCPPPSPRSSSSTCSTRPTARRCDKRYRGLQTAGDYIEDYHIFQTTKEERVMRAIRNGLHGRGHPGRELQGRMGAGPGGDQRPLRRRAEMADRHVVMKNGIKEIAHAQGKAVTFMAKWRLRPRRLELPHPHPRCGSADGKTPLFLDESAELGMCDADAPLHRRAAHPCPRDHLVPRALRQLLQALPGRHLRADQGDLEPRQPHRRLPPVRRGHQGDPHRDAGSAAPTSTPISPSRRCSPPASPASRSRLELEDAIERRRLCRASSCARSRRRCARRPRR